MANRCHGKLMADLIAILMRQSCFEDVDWLWLAVDLIPVFEATTSKGKEITRLLYDQSGLQLASSSVWL